MKNLKEVLLGFTLACLLYHSTDLVAEEEILYGSLNDEKVSVERNEISRTLASCWGSYKPTFGLTVDNINVRVPIIFRFRVPDGDGICNSLAKTYMPYTAVTLESSTQYKILNGVDAWTDSQSGIRMIDDRYCIAIGQGYGAVVGDKIDLVMEDGSVIRCIMGDAKDDMHTDPTRRFQKYDGSVVEMIVDYDYFRKDYNQYPDVFKQRVIYIEVIE